MTYLQPVLPLLLLLSLTIGLLHRRTSRRLHLLSVFATLGLFLWAWPPVAWLFAGSLEWWYRPASFAGKPEAFVVLSGYVEGSETGVDHRLGRDTLVRCAYAAWLHRKWRWVPVVVTGNRLITNLMRVQLAAQGVPEEMIWTEPQSTSTAENAIYSARLLREKNIRRIALVTEGFHMLRAEACFRKQGFEVQPAPCAFRTLTFGESVSDWIPGAGAIRSNEEVAHEWVGMAYYWLRGRL
jgi:uncharacterized SAM-binding protein YcdF (DUF218 family)